MQNHAPTIYAYSSLDALFKGEVAGGAKTNLPDVSGKPVHRAAECIKLKRAYDPVSRTDGRRFLIERLWPRPHEGEAPRRWLAQGRWVPAPHKWFGHSPGNWDSFRTPSGRRRLSRATQSPQERLVTSVDALPGAERARPAVTLQRLVLRMALPRARPPMFFEERATSERQIGRLRDTAAARATPGHLPPDGVMHAPRRRIHRAVANRDRPWRGLGYRRRARPALPRAAARPGSQADGATRCVRVSPAALPRWWRRRSSSSASSPRRHALPRRHQPQAPR
jgi:uncharacterized protein YeaO (DUF488 family)